MISRRKFFTLAAGVSVSAVAVSSLDLRRRITGKTFHSSNGSLHLEGDTVYEHCTFHCYGQAHVGDKGSHDILITNSHLIYHPERHNLIERAVREAIT